MSMRKILKKVISVALAATFALAMTACGSSTEKKTEEAGLVHCTMAFSTWIGSGPFYIAKEKGFFEENGLDVDIKIIDDESTFASLLGSQQIDALGHVMDRDVINFTKGIEETCIMPYDQSSGGDGIIASAEIQSVEDLKGKKVALDKSATGYFFFLTVLAEAGIDESEVTIVDMDADSAATAFVQGQVDAAETWEPWLSNANEREGGHLLCSSADYPDTIVDCVFMTNAFIKEHPDEVKGFVKAWNEAVDWYYDGNQDEGNKIMAEGLNIEVADAESQVAGVTWYNKDTAAEFFDESADNNIYDMASRAVDFWAERKIVDKTIDVKDFITSDYLEK